MTSLTQGGEPLATEEEYDRWMRTWWDAHPAHYVEDPSAPGERRRVDSSDPPMSEMPRPIQRRHALSMLEAQELLMRIERTTKELKLWEATRNDPHPPDEAAVKAMVQREEPALRAKWEAWREELIPEYRLEGLVI